MATPFKGKIVEEFESMSLARGGRSILWMCYCYFTPSGKL